MKRTEAARAGAEKLMRAEAAIDAALRETAELMGLLPTLRLETKLSAVLGQEAVANLGRDPAPTSFRPAGRSSRPTAPWPPYAAQIGCGALADFPRGGGDMDKIRKWRRICSAAHRSGLHAVASAAWPPDQGPAGRA
jgi:hypothetical protein